MSTLRILMLGPPEVYLGEKMLNIRRLPPRGILYYLAERGSPLDRDELINLLSDEEKSSEKARLVFRQALHRLKRELQDPTLLITDTQVVTLDWKRTYVDVLEFRQLLKQVNPHLTGLTKNQPLPHWIVHALHQAVDLWRTPAFLPGAKIPETTTMELWFTFTESELTKQRLRLLESLSAHHESVGHIEQAINFAEQALVENVWNTDLHTRLTHLWRQSPNPRTAWEHYRKLKAKLQTQIDPDVMQEITDLYKRIQKTPASQKTAKPLDFTLLPTIDAPFVGRHKLLSHLQARYQKDGCTIILGPSGMGKSRLLKEFSHRLTDNQNVLLTRCHLTERDVPFHPFIKLLRQDIQPRFWHNLSPTSCVSLSYLLPELADLTPETAKTTGNKEQVPDALQQLFKLLHRENRLILCLEDAQWGDKETLETVELLINRAPFTQGAMLILTARAEVENPQIKELQQTVQQNPRHHVIHLPPFEFEETQVLIMGVFQRQPSDEFTQTLHQRSGGNPYFLLELLYAIIQSTTAPDISIPPPALTIPDSIHYTIQEYIYHLPAIAQRMLEILTISTFDCTPALLSLALARPVEELQPLLDSLCSQALLTAEKNEIGATMIRFKPGPLRECLLKDISPQRKTELHLILARTLETLLKENTEPQAATLALHYEEAEHLHRAFKYQVQAGRHARTLGSSSEARRAFNHAQQLIDQISPPLSNAEIYDMYSEWSNLLLELNEPVLLRKVNTQLLKIGQQQDNPWFIGTALSRFGDACLVESQFSEGIKNTERADTYLQTANQPVSHIQNAIRRAECLYLMGQVDKAIQTLEKAQEQTNDLPDEPKIKSLQAKTHSHLGMAYTLLGRPGDGLGYLSRALETFILENHTYDALTSQAALAITHILLSNYQAANKICQEGIEQAEVCNNWRYLSYLHVIQAAAAAALGEIEIAQSQAYRAISLAQPYSNVELIAQGYKIVGDLFFYLEAPAYALAYYQRSEQNARESYLEPEILACLGLSLAYTGETQQGTQYIQQATSLSEVKGLVLANMRARLAQAYIAFRSGQTNQALSLAQTLSQETDQCSLPVEHLQAELLLAQIAWQRENIKNALQKAQDVGNQAMSLSCFWIELNAQRMLLQLTRQMGIEPKYSIRRLPALLQKLEANMTIPKPDDKSAIPHLLPKAVAVFHQKLHLELGLPYKLSDAHPQ
ncbi:MAG: AAA family ATPase [Chloroflexota bacterium]